MTKLAPFGRGG